MGGIGNDNPVCCARRCNQANDEKTMKEEELKLAVPTYVRNLQERKAHTDENPDFGSPHVPVLIHEADGVRIVLGTHDYDDYDTPDIQIERRPNGWAIFLHPLGGVDPSGYVYFLDDGRSFVVPGREHGAAQTIQVIAAQDDVPELDRPQPTEEAEENDVDPPAIIGGGDPYHRPSL
jgi:hypothetical protein